MGHGFKAPGFGYGCRCCKALLMQCCWEVASYDTGEETGERTHTHIYIYVCVYACMYDMILVQAQVQSFPQSEIYRNYSSERSLILYHLTIKNYVLFACLVP